MLSHTQQALLRKLSVRKHRWKEKLFIAEGRKVVKDLLASGLKPHLLVAQEDTGWSEKEAVLLPEKEFQKWSKLETADQVLGVFPFPEFTDDTLGDLVLILDEVRDPGNMGTILRTCDWFNVRQVYCTKGSTDIYNAKAVQGSMGSLSRVEVNYAEAEEIYELLKASHKLVCAHMTGTALNEWTAEFPLALILGNESQGPSDFWLQRSEHITIPAVGNQGVESLNVAIANAVILGRIRLGGGEGS